MQIPSIDVERIENGVARASRIPGYDPAYAVVYFGDTEEDGVIPERWQSLKQVSCEQAADHAEAMEVYFE